MLKPTRPSEKILGPYSHIGNQSPHLLYDEMTDGDIINCCLEDWKQILQVKIKKKKKKALS